MKRLYSLLSVVSISAIAAPALATLFTIYNPANPASDLVNALVVPSSGINVVGGSAAFIGGSNQTSFTSGVNLDADASFQPAGTFAIGNGVLFTSGAGNPALTNTSSNSSPSVGAGGGASGNPFFTGLCGQCANTNNPNILSFSFTVGTDITSISLDFIFGSDEFPNQGVSDIAAVRVDGTNFATFQNGDPLTFDVNNINSDYFNNDFGGPLNTDIEYDGLTRKLSLVGILNPALTEHTIEIGIADTQDTAFDSGLFVANISGGAETGGGGICGGPNQDPCDTAVPEPASLALLLLGLAGLGFARRKQVSL